MTTSSTLHPSTDFPTEALRESDARYDTARSAFNAMIDPRPAAIVSCRTADDVRRGIVLARERDLVLSARLNQNVRARTGRGTDR